MSLGKNIFGFSTNTFVRSAGSLVKTVVSQLAKYQNTLNSLSIKYTIDFSFEKIKVV